MDIIQSFMLDGGLFRGVFIAADQSLQELNEKHQYPQAVKKVLNECAVMAFALSNGLKYDGRFALQLRGQEKVSSVYVDVTKENRIRGYAVYDQTASWDTDISFRSLFPTGELLFSVSQIGQEPYQGIVQLTGETLVQTVQSYFDLSVQIPTLIITDSDQDCIRCLLIQKMPDKKEIPYEIQNDLWETVRILAKSVQHDELFGTLTPKEILFRLFHEHQLVIFNEQKPFFSCDCHRDKMFRFLKKLTPIEREELYQNNQIITSCQFCGQEYTFKKEELE